MIRLRVKEVAQKQGISQSKLGRRADIDLTTLRKIYVGDANITLETLNRLANALQVDAKMLIEYTPDE